MKFSYAFSDKNNKGELLYDLFGAKEPKVFYQQPDGLRGVKDATIVEATNSIEADFPDTPGEWRFKAHVSFKTFNVDTAEIIQTV